MYYMLYSVCLFVCLLVTGQLLASMASWRHQLLLCCRVSTDVGTPAITPHTLEIQQTVLKISVLCLNVIGFEKCNWLACNEVCSWLEIQQNVLKISVFYLKFSAFEKCNFLACNEVCSWLEIQQNVLKISVLYLKFSAFEKCNLLACNEVCSWLEIQQNVLTISVL